MRATGSARALSRISAFWCRGYLGIITALIWVPLIITGVILMLSGRHEEGFNFLIAAGWTTISIIWGGVIMWAWRREPMRKVVTEVRDGQERILGRLDELSPPEPPRLAVVREFPPR